MTVLTESRSLLVALACCLLVCACQGYAKPTVEDATKSVKARVSTQSRTWDSQVALSPSDGIAHEQFGVAVAIDGNTTLVGAPGDNDTLRVANSSGSVYAWLRSGSQWQLQQKFESPDPSASQQFGSALAVSGDVAAIAAIGDNVHGEFSGAAYVFIRTDTTWTPAPQKLAGDEISADFGEEFGFSIAVANDTILVGAPGSDDKGEDAGAAYVFKGEGASWTLVRKLFAADPVAGAEFGYSVALSNGIAVVGATDSDATTIDMPTLDAGTPQPGTPDTGAVYVFSGDFSGPARKLVSSDHATGDLFGLAVAAYGSTIAVGAISASGGLDPSAPPQAGAVYVFNGSDSNWVEQQKLFKPEPKTGDSFGSAVSVGGDSLFVVSPTDIGGGSSAFVFTLTQGLWSTGTQIVPPVDLAAGTLFAQAAGVSGETAIVGTLGEKALVLALASGSPCSIADDCILGNCTEGTCCSTPCAGTCVSCLAARKTSGIDDGTCGPVLAATDPRDSCDAQAKSTCGTTGFCDGKGACSLYPAETVCVDAGCSTPTSTNRSACDSYGTCATTPGEDCGSYQCRAGQCLTACTSNGDCAPNSFCTTASKCELSQPPRCNANNTGVIGPDGTTLTVLCGDFKCVVDACLTTCTTVKDCSDGLGCNTATGACLPKCTTATTCAGGQACDPVDHVCTKVCSSAQDCPDDDNCGPVSHQCTKNTDCKRRGDCASGLDCDLAAGRCAKKCTAAADCPGANDACNPSNGICVSACSKATDCKEGLNCGASRTCTTDIRCAQSSDCAAALVCDPVGHNCTQSCSADSPCDNNLACSPVNNVCTKFCTAAADCGGGFNCGPTTHECTPTTTCSASTDCATGLVCSPNSHQCTADEEHSPSPVGCSCSLDRTPSNWNRWGAPVTFLALFGLTRHRRAGRIGTFFSTPKRKRRT